jgi:hypothetical protein
MKRVKDRGRVASRMRHWRLCETAVHDCIALAGTTSVAPAARIHDGGLAHLGASQTSPHPGTTTSERRDRDLTTLRTPPPHSLQAVNCTREHQHRHTHHPHTSPWSTRSSSGAVSVMPSPPTHTASLLANHHGLSQASPHDYGSSALRCARSSTRSRSGSTLCTPELVAALDTGSWAWNTASSGCWPTDGTSC